MIKVDYQLAYYINKELERQNDNYRRKRIYDWDYCIFYDDEIKNITSLTFDGIDNIDGLDYFKNLKKLVIENKFLEKTNIPYDENIEYQYNTFKDFTPIENLYNLETLIIMDNMFIKSLDLKKLKQLKHLLIINTPNLEELKNLDNLKNLKTVIICGTKVSTPIDYKKYKNNTRTCTKNFLDINMYPNLKNYIYNDQDVTSIRFCERVGQFDMVSLTPRRVDRIYGECLNMIRNSNLLNKPLPQILRTVYDYVIDKVKFDYEGLARRYDLIKNNPHLAQSKKHYFSMIHSSYNALLRGKSNCEGYVNLMNFILNMLGIKSYDVHCKLNSDDTITTNNHSIIKIKLNDEYFYCDPSLEDVTNRDYYMKSYDEITKTHSLGLFEELNYRNSWENDDDENNKRYYRE